jgi:FkbM family methyltransferase
MHLLKVMRAIASGHAKGHFGQYAEDTLVRKLFKPRKTEELCLDIGAYHPFRFNNTAYFWMCGWKTINIDANPNSIQLFNKWRSSDTNIHSAVVTQKEIDEGLKNIQLMLPKNDDKDGVSANGTISDSQAQSNGMKRSVVVPVCSIKQILEKYDLEKVVYINIDIEGYDDRVAIELDLNKYRPKAITVEQFGDDIEQIIYSDVAKHMRNNDYVFHARAGFTSVFVRKD